MIYDDVFVAHTIQCCSIRRASIYLRAVVVDTAAAVVNAFTRDAFVLDNESKMLSSCSL